MFLGYIHSFRAFAIFLIVAGHVISVFDWSRHEMLERAVRIFISNGTVLFVFIAGYLFQHLLSRYEPKKYFHSKLRNVITPYIVMSIPAIIVFTLFLHREGVWAGFYQEPVWKQVAYFYLTGKQLAPYWFIPMIALFYLASPLLAYLDKNKIFYLLLPVYLLLACLVGRGEFPYVSFIHFFPVYVLGMLCSRYKSETAAILTSKKMLVGTLVGVLIFGLIELLYMSGTMTYMNLLQKILLSLFLLGLLIKLGDRVNNPYIYLIADYSFGIYFLHSYIITGIKLAIYELRNAHISENLLAYALVTIAIFLFCVALVYSVKRLVGTNSRLVLGS